MLRLRALLLLALAGLAAGFAPMARRGLQRAAPLAMSDFNGETMIMTEENVQAVLEDARGTLGTMFGYLQENRAVGITGEVELAGLDGPCVVLRLSGRFWHERKVVLARVGSFLTERIPEIIEVNIEHPDQLDDADKVDPGAGGPDVFGFWAKDAKAKKTGIWGSASG
eukprot:CAMPEP_0118878054 /NCGR_PEP_ID=MMETSP1163-20130328/18117_1 /TAXON_ID=124430 /ORGANISM="Phaeomonas parva, Strain CCMP2877" /LENGTH=167 /DNA_ID=CAMNT_0006813835 /DNA_START=150 /DNA_END=654 /DNA_ORIENTATION=-